MYVWSTDDIALGREAAEATAQYVSGPYRFEVLEGVSHWIPETAPDQLNGLLLDFSRARTEAVEQSQFILSDTQKELRARGPRDVRGAHRAARGRGRPRTRRSRGTASRRASRWSCRPSGSRSPTGEPEPTT